jgi:uncharacterized 2Fe-2S/4Fe-4S cluster protein (DUF4445 family)
MLQTCNVGVVSRRRREEGGLRMLDVARITGHNMVATCGGRGKKDA